MLENWLEARAKVVNDLYPSIFDVDKTPVELE
jgi:hypothetical protein